MGTKNKAHIFVLLCQLENQVAGRMGRLGGLSLLTPGLALNLVLPFDEEAGVRNAGNF